MSHRPVMHRRLVDVESVSETSGIAGTDAVVIIVVVILSTLLAAHGMPLEQMVQVLLAAGLISITVVKTYHAAPLRVVRTVLSRT